MSSFSEQEIIRGCQQQNKAFQEQLYRQYYSLFLKICARYAKNMEDAEQLLHDGMLRVFKNVHSFKNNGSFEGWMKKIMVNTCLDYLKSKQLRDSLRLSFSGVINDQTPISLPNEAIKSLEFKELLQLIQTLPAVSKTVFNLYVFEGYSHKEIASMLTITEGTSSWHLHHARSILQKKLSSINADKPLYETKRV